MAKADWVKEIKIKYIKLYTTCLWGLRAYVILLGGSFMVPINLSKTSIVLPFLHLAMDVEGVTMSP